MSSHWKRIAILTAALLAGLVASKNAKADPPGHPRENIFPNLEEGLVPMFVLGDLNEDGRVDKKDLDLMKQIVNARAGSPAPAAATCIAAGDLDYNRRVDQQDLDRLNSWLANDRPVTIPALGFQPTLPCAFRHPILATWMDTPPGASAPIRFLGPGVSAKNAKVSIQSGPATVRLDDPGYLVEISPSSKPGDLVAALVTLPNGNKYLYTYQVTRQERPPPMKKR